MLRKLGLVSRSQIQRPWPFAVERDAPGALASARAAPDKLTTDLTLSSAERRRFAARTGATINVAREQELRGKV